MSKKYKRLGCPYCGRKMVKRTSKLICFKYVLICSGGIKCPVTPYVQGDVLAEMELRINTRAI